MQNLKGNRMHRIPDTDCMCLFKHFIKTRLANIFVTSVADDIGKLLS